MAATSSSSPRRLLLRALSRAGTSVYVDVASNVRASVSIPPCKRPQRTSSQDQPLTGNRLEQQPSCREAEPDSDLVLADVVLYDIVSKGVITLAPHQLAQQGGVGFEVACVDAEGGLWYLDPQGVLQFADCPKPGGNSWGLEAPGCKRPSWLWACDAAGQVLQSWELPCTDVHQGRAGLKALTTILRAAAPAGPGTAPASNEPPHMLAQKQQQHQAARARSVPASVSSSRSSSSSSGGGGGNTKPPRVLLVEVYAGTQPMLQAATASSANRSSSSSSSSRPPVELAGVCVVEMGGQEHSPAATCAGIPALWLLGADMTHPSTLDALQRWARAQLATTAVDVVLLAGGPPCNAYSQLNWSATEQQLAQADRRVAALRLADTLLRDLAAAAGVAFRVVVENPHSNSHRALRNRAVLQQYAGSVPGLYMTVQNYCQWDTACPMKPTDIWTDIPGLQPRLCTPDTPCQQLGQARKHKVQLVGLPKGPQRAAWPLALARHLLGCLAADVAGVAPPPFPPPDEHPPSRKRSAAPSASDGPGRSAAWEGSSGGSSVVVLESGTTTPSSSSDSKPGMSSADGSSWSGEVTTPAAAAPGRRCVRATPASASRKGSATPVHHQTSDESDPQRWAVAAAAAALGGGIGQEGTGTVRELWHGATRPAGPLPAAAAAHTGVAAPAPAQPGPAVMQAAPAQPMAAAAALSASSRDSVSSLSTSSDSVSSLTASTDTAGGGTASTDTASSCATSRHDGSSVTTPSHTVQSLTTSGSSAQKSDSDSELVDLTSSESEADVPAELVASVAAAAVEYVLKQRPTARLRARHHE